MKKFAAWIVTGALMTGGLALSAGAQDLKKDAAPAAGDENKEGVVTQAELARMLVAKLGLARFLPPTPTDQQCFGILVLNGVSPFDGWDATKPVVSDDLAVIIVKSLKAEGMVEKKDDIKSWIEACKQLGISFESSGAAVSAVTPRAGFPVAMAVLTTSPDQLTRREIPVSTSENNNQFLGIVPPSAVQAALAVIVTPPPAPPKPKPVTPN